MNKYLLVLALLIPVSLFGQNAEKEQKTFSVGISPFTATNYGLQLEFDFRLKNNHWLAVSPQFYMDNLGDGGGYYYDDSWYSSSYENMYGLGVDVQHRIYFRNRRLPKGFYMGYGPSFKFFSLDENGYVPRTYMENGTEYIELRNTTYNTKIYKLGANIIFGYQFVFFDMMYLDLYAGTGFRLSYDNRTSGLHKSYDDSWLDVGYSGILMVGGVRIGVTF